MVDWRQDERSVAARRAVRAWGGQLRLLAVRTGFTPERIGEIHGGALVSEDEAQRLAQFFNHPERRHGLGISWRVADALSRAAGGQAPVANEVDQMTAKAQRLTAERQERERASRENLKAVEAQVRDQLRKHQR